MGSLTPVASTLAAVATTTRPATRPLSSRWTYVGDGGCRDAAGASFNSYMFYTVTHLEECQDYCMQDVDRCTGLEFRPTETAAINCQLQQVAITQSAGDPPGSVLCYALTTVETPEAPTNTATTATMAEAGAADAAATADPRDSNFTM